MISDDVTDFSGFDNRHWIGTVKRNGWFCEISSEVDGIKIYSGGGEVMDALSAAFSDISLPIGTVIAGELLALNESACTCKDVKKGESFGTSSHFRVNHPEASGIAAFDLLMLAEKDITNEPYISRRIKLRSLLEKLDDPRLVPVETKPDGISVRDWLNTLIDRNAEGAVFNEINGKYLPDNRVSHVMKWKPVITYDVVITGLGKKTVYMPEGWVRLQYGINGKVIGTLLGDDAAGPKEEMEKHLGRVVEVNARGLLPTGALLYPRLINFRDDKQANECDLYEARPVRV